MRELNIPKSLMEKSSTAAYTAVCVIEILFAVSAYIVDGDGQRALVAMSLAVWAGMAARLSYKKNALIQILDDAYAHQEQARQIRELYGKGRHDG